LLDDTEFTGFTLTYLYLHRLRKLLRRRKTPKAFLPGDSESIKFAIYHLRHKRISPVLRTALPFMLDDTEFISFTLIMTCIVSAKLLPASKDAEGVFAWVPELASWKNTCFHVD